MNPNINTLERAFQLASSGKCTTIRDIKVALKTEHYDVNELQGPVLLAQLRELIRSQQPPLENARQDNARALSQPSGTVVGNSFLAE